MNFLYKPLYGASTSYDIQRFEMYKTISLKDIELVNAVDKDFLMIKQMESNDRPSCP